MHQKVQKPLYFFNKINVEDDNGSKYLKLIPADKIGTKKYELICWRFTFRKNFRKYDAWW